MTATRSIANLAILLAAASLTLAACGGHSGKPSTSTSASPSTSTATTAAKKASSPSAAAANHDAITKRYMDEIAADSTRHDASITKPGSLAATYAEYEATFSRASISSGQPESLAKASQISAGEWLLSDTTGAGYTYNAFRYDTAGRIVSFSVNGRPLAGRLARGTDASGGGVKLTNVISHLSTSGRVYVTFDAQNTRSDQAVRVEYQDYNVPPTLIASSGQQFGVVDGSGPTELQPGASSSYAMEFGAAPDPGRQFRIELLPSLSLNEVYVSTSLHRMMS